MSDGLNLTSVEGIQEVAAAITRARTSIEMVATRARGHIEDFGRQIAQRGSEIAQEVEDARYALRHLDEDESGEWERERLEEALLQLRKFRAVADDCAMLRRRFDARLTRLSERGGTLTVKSAHEFGEIARDARAYRAITLDGFAPDGSAAEVMAHGAPAKNRAVLRGSPIELPPGCAPADVGPPLPAGFVWLDLEALSETDFIAKPEDFRKDGPETIAHGIELLRDEVFPLMADDHSLDYDRLRAIDEERGTLWDERGFVHPDSLSNIWNIFFDPRAGADTLCVGRKAVNGMPYIPGGRHRLGIARQKGIRYMPAKVISA